MEELSSETDETDAERAPAGRQPEPESQIPSETPAPEPLRLVPDNQIPVGNLILVHHSLF